MLIKSDTLQVSVIKSQELLAELNFRLSPKFENQVRVTKSQEPSAEDLILGLAQNLRIKLESLI